MIVTLGAISGQMIFLQKRQIPGAVEPGRLQHLLADALHAGQEHEGGEAQPVPDIRQDDAAQRRRFVAEPGAALDVHQGQGLVDEAEERMEEQLPEEADDHRRQDHRQEDDHLMHAMAGQRLQQGEGQEEGRAVLEHHQERRRR